MGQGGPRRVFCSSWFELDFKDLLVCPYGSLLKKMMTDRVSECGSPYQ